MPSSRNAVPTTGNPMPTRRTFLTALAGLPFVGKFLQPNSRSSGYRHDEHETPNLLKSIHGEPAGNGNFSIRLDSTNGSYCVIATPESKVVWHDLVRLMNGEGKMPWDRATDLLWRLL